METWNQFPKSGDQTNFWKEHGLLKKKLLFVMFEGFSRIYVGSKLFPKSSTLSLVFSSCGFSSWSSHFEGFHFFKFFFFFHLSSFLAIFFLCFFPFFFLSNGFFFKLKLFFK